MISTPTIFKNASSFQVQHPHPFLPQPYSMPFHQGKPPLESHRRQKGMILLKTRRRRIMQTDHMPRPHRDKILAPLRLGEQRASLRLRTVRPGPARRVQAEDVVAVPRDDVHGRRRLGSGFQPGVDA